MKVLRKFHPTEKTGEEDSSSFQPPKSTAASNLDPKECPFCFEYLDYPCLVLLHVINKHRDQYWKLRCSTADELCAKIPAAKGSTVEEKMRQNESKSKLEAISGSTVVPPNKQVPRTDYSSLQSSCPPQNSAVADTVAKNDDTMDNSYQQFFDGLNLEFNENDVSENSSPCWPSSNQQGDDQEWVTREIYNNILGLADDADDLTNVVSNEKEPEPNIPPPRVLHHACDPKANEFVNRKSLLSTTSSSPTIDSLPTLRVAGSKTKSNKSSVSDSTSRKRPKSEDPTIHPDRLTDAYGACRKITYRNVVGCLVCQKEFASAEEVFEHEVQKHPELKRYQCPVMPHNLPICKSEKFPTVEAVHKHLVAFHKFVPWSLHCTWCSKSTSSFVEYNQHIDQEYRDRRLALIRSVLHQQITVRCRKCKSVFNTKRAWYCHRANVCYRTEPESDKNVEMAKTQSQLTHRVQRDGCLHNQQMCQYYPMCSDNCPYAHPICQQDVVTPCRERKCIDDHAKRKKTCSFCLP